MSDLQLTSTLERLREQVAVLRDQNEYPAIERCLQMVDMNLHLALWELGEIDEPLLELDPDGSDG
jgi:hypothetical protein